eukprot:scaffold1166_cov261-Pinguiococcus_pyrenoidosus.AAC.38
MPKYKQANLRRPCPVAVPFTTSIDISGLHFEHTRRKHRVEVSIDSTSLPNLTVRLEIPEFGRLRSSLCLVAHRRCQAWCVLIAAANQGALLCQSHLRHGEQRAMHGSRFRWSLRVLFVRPQRATDCLSFGPFHRPYRHLCLARLGCLSHRLMEPLRKRRAFLSLPLRTIASAARLARGADGVSPFGSRCRGRSVPLVDAQGCAPERDHRVGNVVVVLQCTQHTFHTPPPTGAAGTACRGSSRDHGAWISSFAAEPEMTGLSAAWASRTAFRDRPAIQCSTLVSRRPLRQKISVSHQVVEPLSYIQRSRPAQDIVLTTPYEGILQRACTACHFLG